MAMGKNERAERCLLPLQMACYHAVHDFKGGVGAMDKAFQELMAEAAGFIAIAKKMGGVE